MQNKDDLIHAFNVNPEYLPEAPNSTVTDYRHWHVRCAALRARRCHPRRYRWDAASAR